MTEIGNENKQKFFFNSNVNKYIDELHFERLPAKIKARELCNEINKFFNINSNNNSLLEIGAGSGFFTQFSSKAIKCNYYTIDISKEMLNSMPESVINTINLCGSVYSLPFPENSLDFVIGHGILHHLDLTKSIKEIYRILKPGGKIFFYEPNAMNPLLFITHRHKWIPLYSIISEDETAYFKWEIYSEFKIHKFKKIKIVPTEFMMNQFPDSKVNFFRKLSKLLSSTPIIKEFGGSLKIYGEK